MRRVKRPIVPVSTAVVLLLGIVGMSCKFSFADSDRPSRGSVDFGSGRKPAIESPPAIAQFRNVFADIAEEVVPTVVSVVPTRIDTITFRRNPFYHFFDDPSRGDDPFDFFFRGPRSRQPRRREPQVEKRERRLQGLGSGVIVSKEGYILTNYHVVSGADEIEVKLQDKRVFDAEIVGSDSLSDVAVIKITEKADDLPVAYLGDSEKLRPGDWVMAIGNPFSLTSTVTAGIVSAKGRAVSGGRSYQSFIQTDAAINPGNSGGALVNLDGELIGINTMIFSRTGGYMGIGFAIPINMARWVMEDLIYEGKVSRGWLGVKIQNLSAATREAFGLSDKFTGVLVADVFEGQPAARAGVKRGDVVISINGVDVDDVNELRNTVAGIDPGKSVPLVVMRDGKEVVLSVKLGERDEESLEKGESTEEKDEDEDSEGGSAESLGLTVKSITGEMRKQYGLDKDVKGVVITDVAPSSQAAQEGLRPGDVVKELGVGGKRRVAVTSAKAFKRELKGVKEGDAVMFLLERDGGTFFVAFKVRK